MPRDYLKEFQAKGGMVKHLPEGIAYGVNKDADRAKRSVLSDNELIDQRHVRCIDHMGRAIITNGLGELIAVE